VRIVTKDTLAAGSTAWAKGGLAAVLDPGDTFAEHVRDTLQAGAGLCDEEAVRQLVNDASTAVSYLESLGAAFDPGADGAHALTREGGHSHSRIVHSGGDRSGAEIQRTLDINAVNAGVEVLDHAFALDLVMGRGDKRQVAGVRIALLDKNGAVTSVGVVHARAVVIATGGVGQIFASTSNPRAVTGDGHALALRAGLRVRDMEFVQFHPTVLWQGVNALEQQTLISEAVRGEGAVLLDAAGERIMKGVHPQEDLAPRDVVAIAIHERMARAVNGVDDHVFLDARPIGERFRERFPFITEACARAGIDPTKDLIPVSPAAHYSCGGILSNMDGTTEVEGLFAVGEVAYTGVHGANRLASNSLTESLVVGTRVGRNLAWRLPQQVPSTDAVVGDAGLLDESLAAQVRQTMSRHVGVLRTPEGLAHACDTLAAIADKTSADITPSRASFEATNILTAAVAVAHAAAARKESRGCHRRSDVTTPVDSSLVHLDVSLVNGEISIQEVAR